MLVVTNCCVYLRFYIHVRVNSVCRRTSAKTMRQQIYTYRCIDKTQSYSLSETRASHT